MNDERARGRDNFLFLFLLFPLFYLKILKEKKEINTPGAPEREGGSYYFFNIFLCFPEINKRKMKAKTSVSPKGRGGHDRWIFLQSFKIIRKKKENYHLTPHLSSIF